MREAGDYVAFFFRFARLDTDEIGAVGIDDADRLALDADDVLSVCVADADVLRARVSRERNVVELLSVLRDDGMAGGTVRAYAKKDGRRCADEEQRADEQAVVFLHGCSLP